MQSSSKLELVDWVRLLLDSLEEPDEEYTMEELKNNEICEENLRSGRNIHSENHEVLSELSLDDIEDLPLKVEKDPLYVLLVVYRFKETIEVKPPYHEVNVTPMDTAEEFTYDLVENGQLLELLYNEYDIEFDSKDIEDGTLIDMVHQETNTVVLD